MFKVTSSFALGGDLSDYDDAAQTSIRRMLAKEADVPVSAVEISLGAGSVLVESEITLASQADADASAEKLAAGVLSDSKVLEKALQESFNADGVTHVQVVVQQIMVNPSVASTGPPIGLIVGSSVGGVLALLLVIVIVMLNRLTNVAKKIAPEPTSAGPARNMARKREKASSSELEPQPTAAQPEMTPVVEMRDTTN